MAFKKIVCVLIVCAFFAAFGLQAAGAESDIVDLDMRQVATGYMKTNTGNQILDYKESYELPTPSFRSVLYLYGDANYNSSATRLYLAAQYNDQFTGTSARHVFQSGYTYVGEFQCRFIYQNAASQVKMSYANISSDLWLTDTLKLYNGQNLSSSSCYQLDSAYYTAVASAYAANIEFQDTVEFQFVFTMPDLETIPNEVFTVCLIPDLRSAMTLGAGDLVTIEYVLTNLSGYYDPTGEIAESETDKIIEAQRETAQWQLDEEARLNQAALDAAMNGVDSSVFDLSSFATSFSQLFQGMNYQGSDFHFMLPGSGVVPYVGVELWQQSEIPFKTWIDAIPAGIMAVVRFVAWFALAWAFIMRIRALIQDINGGDE